MASVFNRGTKDHPRWYARYKDVSGAWRSQKTSQETKRDALRIALALEAQEERRRMGLEAPANAALSCGELMRRWAGGLANRAARNDQWRIHKHIIPRFETMAIGDLSVAALMLWLDDLRAAKAMKEGSQRGLFTLMSRFCTWAVDREFMESNPCKGVKAEKLPRARHNPDIPWIVEDAVVVRAMEALPEPIRFLFFLGNRCGLRTGEAAGLRMSDLAQMDRGIIRVRFSYLGPLKEDKHGSGKAKFVPAPKDAPSVLKPWLARRALEGALGEDLVFPREGRFPYRKEHTEYHWRHVRDALELGEMTWYQATRHSFATRNLAAGASMEEISDALGHSTTASTEANYIHLKRRSFSDPFRRGLNDDPPDLSLAGQNDEEDDAA